MSVYQQWTFNDSHWLKSRWFQIVSNCSCWQTSIGQPVLFEYRTGCEWHPSNQKLQCPVVTIRCYPWSAGSWQAFHIVGLCVFSHQSADYSIVVAHLTSNSFERHPCCMTWFDYDFWCFNATFNNISAISWRPVLNGGGSRNTRREPPTMGKQMVNFITCDCESRAPFFVIYKAGSRWTHVVLVIGLYELLDPTT